MRTVYARERFGDRRSLLTPTGQSLGEIAADLEISQAEDVRLRIFVDHEFIPHEDGWAAVVPADGSFVQIQQVPSKAILPFLPILLLVAGIALIAFGGAALIVAAGEMMVNAAIIAGVGMLLQLVVSAFVKPQQPSGGPGDRSDSLFLAGARNSARRFSPFPRIFGRIRVRPSYGAFPYTEVIGGESFMRLLFVIGYGPLDITQLRIGETAIEEFDDVEVEVVAGFDDSPAITLYPGQVVQETLNVLLTSDRGKTTGFQLRTTDIETDEIGVEFHMPLGLGKFTDDGKKKNIFMAVVVQYRAVGAGGWNQLSMHHVSAPNSAGFGLGSFAFHNYKLGLILLGARGRVSRGQYEVQVKGLLANGQVELGDSGSNMAKIQWTALKSIRHDDPVPKQGIAKVAIRIRATDQLSGNVETFSCHVQSLVPVYDLGSGTWGPPIHNSNSPAWAYAEVLRGTANPEPVLDKFMDGPAFVAWDLYCREHELQFNGVVDFRGTVYKLLSDIASVGRATPHMRDGRFSIVVDKDRSAEPPDFLITPANCAEDSFQMSKTFVKQAHAIRVPFKNQHKDFEDDEVLVYADGYDISNARLFEEGTAWGLTREDLVIKYTKFLLKQPKWRSVTYTVLMDIEHTGIERGDIGLFAYDVPLLGLSYGRVITTTLVAGFVTELHLNEIVKFEDGKTYGLVVRNKDGALTYPALVNPASAGTPIVETQDLVLTAPIAQLDVESVVTFGELGIETIRVLVTSKEPQDDFSAIVELKDEAPQLHLGDGEELPPDDPVVIFPVDVRPMPPVILDILSNVNGITMILGPNEGERVFIRFWEGAYREVGADTWISLPSINAQQFGQIITGQLPPGHYDIRARAIGSALSSEWVEVLNFFHALQDVLPEDLHVTNLSIQGEFEGDVWFQSTFSIHWNFAIDGVRQSPIVGVSPVSELEGLSTPDESGESQFPRLSFIVRVLDPDTGAVRRVELTTGIDYDYTIAMNKNDGLRRDIRFEVAPVLNDRVGKLVRVTGRNEPPPLPVFRGIAGATLVLEWEFSPYSRTDRDATELIIWAKRDAALAIDELTPDLIIYKGPFGTNLPISVVMGAVYHLRYAMADEFSENPAFLNVSEEVVQEAFGVGHEQLGDGAATQIKEINVTGVNIFTGTDADTWKTVLEYTNFEVVGSAEIVGPGDTRGPNLVTIEMAMQALAERTISELDMDEPADDQHGGVGGDHGDSYGFLIYSPPSGAYPTFDWRVVKDLGLPTEEVLYPPAGTNTRTQISGSGYILGGAQSFGVLLDPGLYNIALQARWETPFYTRGIARYVVDSGTYPGVANRLEGDGADWYFWLHPEMHDIRLPAVSAIWTRPTDILHILGNDGFGNYLKLDVSNPSLGNPPTITGPTAFQSYEMRYRPLGDGGIDINVKVFLELAQMRLIETRR